MKHIRNNVRSKMKIGESYVFRDGEGGNPAGTPVGVSSLFVPAYSHGDSIGEGVGKSSIYKMITSTAEAWVGKKPMPWSRELSESQSGRFSSPWMQNFAVNSEISQNEAFESGLSFSVNSSSSSGSGSGSSSSIHKFDAETDCLNYEIIWEDLTIGEQIGQGSCGTVYHGLWYGSDVAIKLFSKQEYSEEVIFSFSRSLFRLLQKSTSKLDWRRRIHMALDIARGMYSLHNCNPPIVHRDLKSSNLLVDKNWSVKVADFGLSRVKHETYLTTKNGKGTPQWMVPEVLQNDRSNEKSDLYSFGVILWELATQKVPWENLNAMQVIGAVGFMNQRLDIPEDVDPMWASIIQSCWHSEPQSRPTFKELLEKLKDMQNKYGIQSQAAWAASAAVPPKQI